MIDVSYFLNQIFILKLIYVTTITIFMSKRYILIFNCQLIKKLI